MDQNWKLIAFIAAIGLPLLLLWVVGRMLPGIPRPKAWMGIGVLATLEVAFVVFAVWNRSWWTLITNAVMLAVVAFGLKTRVKLQFEAWRFRAAGIRRGPTVQEVYDLMLKVAHTYPKISVTMERDDGDFVRLCFGDLVHVMVQFHKFQPFTEVVDELAILHPQERLGTWLHRPDWVSFYRKPDGVWLKSHQYSPPMP